MIYVQQKETRSTYGLIALLLFGFLGGLFHVAHAQQAYVPQRSNMPLESWRWNDFPQTEGKGVRYLHEYQPNKVWFATNDGLLHFNGYEYQYHTMDEGLSGLPVHLVYVTEDGITIATTDIGIFRYEAENVWRPMATWSQAGSIQFYSIREVSGKRLFLGTNIGVISLKSGEAPIIYTDYSQQEKARKIFPSGRLILFPEGTKNLGVMNNVSDVLEAENGQIWLAVSLNEEDHGYLLRFRPGEVEDNQISRAEVITDIPGSGLGADQKLIQANDGRIWVINNSYRIGINIFDGSSWETISLGEKFGGDEYATSICQTANGNIWIGALGKLFCFNGYSWQLYQAPEYKVPGNKMLLFPSKNGSLWVMGLMSRVTFVDHSEEMWVVYPGLNFQDESEQGYWFLDRNGLAVFNQGDQWWSYGKDEGMIDAPVSIIVTTAGQVWAAGSHQGVAATAALIDGVWQTQQHPQLSWGIDYRAVFEDKDGSLWFGGSVDIDKNKGHLGGVLQLKNPQGERQNWFHHHSQNGLNQSNAYGIGQSTDGRIWVGGGRLFVYDGNTWERAEQDELQEFVNEVFSTDGLLLVGSRFYGIYLNDGNSWRHFDSDSGLISNNIISLYADSDSSIWAVTENDISRYDGSQWINHVLPAEMNMDFEGGQFMRTSDGSCWINKSPREWKRRALSYNQLPPGQARQFITYRYHPDANAPETQILEHPEEIASEGDVMIAWSGFDYLGNTSGENLAFSFRLDGGPWSSFSSDRRHMLTNLSGGVHTLEVRARDLDFNIDPTPAKTSFRVQVPIWYQPWFLILISFFLVVLGIFEYRIVDKNRKLEKLNLNLQNANDKLKEKGGRILEQNQHILEQQKEIILQKERLESAHQNLAESHNRIEQQRDTLKEMVGQVEKLSKAKLNFFTNISHELRTPLSLILGPIEQLSREGDAISHIKKRELLTLVNRNANRLLVLINQLLEIRKIESSSLDFTPEKGHFLQTTQAILELFQDLAYTRDVELTMTHELETDMLWYDKDKVEKILANLLSNAFKHTPANGHIHLSVEKAVIQENGSNETCLRLVVQDDGQGISPENLKRIFDRYYSADRDEQFSTGVGLNYIHDLVEAQGGQIRVVSDMGEGTCVRVDLPYREYSPSELPEPEEAKRVNLMTASLYVASLSSEPVPQVSEALNGGKRRILIIEDHEDMRTFLKGLFSDEYEVILAENGQQGLEAAHDTPPDLIISDIMMPEMDGLEFCAKIKSDLITSHIPVILLTAKGKAPQKIKGYHTGADDYITKPFQTELLEARVKNLLDQRESLRKVFEQQFVLQPKDITLNSPDERMLDKLSKLMEEHIDDSEFNVNKMCEAVELSHMQFIRKIKQLTGKKPVELLKSFRLTRAKNLLIQRKLTISEVAYMVGYDLPNSFSRAFKKEFGISPTEFLEKEEEPPKETQQS